jgi:hypothetical protein
MTFAFPNLGNTTVGHRFHLKYTQSRAAVLLANALVVPKKKDPTAQL